MRALNRSLAAISRHTAVDIVAAAESHGAEASNEQPSHGVVHELPTPADHDQHDAELPVDSTASALIEEPVSGPMGWRQSLYESFLSLRGQPSHHASSTTPSSSSDQRQHLQHHHATWQPQEASSSVPLLGGLLGGRRHQQQRSKPPDPRQLSKTQRQSLWASRHAARRLADGDAAESEPEQEDQVPAESPGHQADLARAEALRQREWLLRSVTSMMEVDEELVETVLGPPKFTDADAEERIVSPGQPCSISTVVFASMASEP